MRRLTGALLALTMLLTACGDDDVAETADDAMGEMSDMDMGDMVMNEPDADTAEQLAEQVEGIDLLTSPFEQFDDVPETYADAAGVANVALVDDPPDGVPGTTVTLVLTGLPAGEEIISHLHAAPCSDRGGPHFMFDAEGEPEPPNEVHLAGVPDDSGALTLNVTNEGTARPAQSVIFHPRADTDTYVACADLYEQG